MTYRTKTYIAADFDSDADAVEQLRKWNNSNYWGLSFHDAHELTQARDSSLPCSIKESLRTRLSASKIFVLIVGEKTNVLTKGGCQFCPSYNSWSKYCTRGHSVDYRSFIKYECVMAQKDYYDPFVSKYHIIVLYKSTNIDRTKCPETVRHIGIHTNMIYKGDDGRYYWDYNSVKKAFDSI